MRHFEQFTFGAGDSAHVVSPSQASLLGASGSLDLHKNQAYRVYKAEHFWDKNTPSRTAQNKTISDKGVSDLAEEAIYHPLMDEIPGIDRIRHVYSATKGDIVQTHFKPEWESEYDGAGSHGVYYPPGQGPTYSRVGSIHLLRGPTLNMGVVSHELSHMLSTQFIETHPDFKQNVDYSPEGNRAYRNAGHSWPMARLHIHLARALFGPEHGAALAYFYKKHGADFGKSARPDDQKRAIRQMSSRVFKSGKP